jgi:glucosamine--fructose-6-phosphate aminotransferase (isomerizing)
MCGIFGIVSLNPENIYERIINGLIQLQNRGYDSSGLCVLNNNHLEVHKYASTPTESSLQKLQRSCINSESNSLCYCTLRHHTFHHHTLDRHTLGIGHNRWATHGVKNDTNAHPHLSNNKQFAVVHNGIIENYAELKKRLISKGFTFFSQTDTEIIVNLISFYYEQLGDTEKSIHATIADLHGTYGIIVMDLKSPDKLFCVRNGSPLLVGKNDDCVIITSEQSGFCNLVSNYITLHNDDICVIERTGGLLIKTSGTYTGKKVLTLNEDLSPEPFAHWTLKEIWYQPTVVLNAINNGGRFDGPSKVKLGGLDQHSSLLKDINNIIILGCGTSYFAGLYGMHFFKRLCNLNTVQVFDGAEFSGNDIPRVGKTAIVLVSQSGETKDLHRCIEIAHQGNAITIGIINVVDSLIAREVDCGVYCNAGKEVGVASTKAFTSQVVCLSLMAIWFSQLHGVNKHLRTRTISDLQNLSNDFKNTIENVEPVIKTIMPKLMNAQNLFILGKGSDECIAKEGSLKVKEISYVHAEGYSASSLKHGPFALLDETFPVIILNLDGKYEAKIQNCVEEVKSRGSPIVLISNTTNPDNNEIGVSANLSYSSLLGIVPIQMLAYYLSVQKGINPDKPKNLAKVVTVE